MQHFSDCDGSAIFRVSAKIVQSGPILINIRCNLTRLRPVQSFDLLGWGSMSLGLALGSHSHLTPIPLSSHFRHVTQVRWCKISSINRSKQTSKEASKRGVFVDSVAGRRRAFASHKRIDKFVRNAKKATNRSISIECGQDGVQPEREETTIVVDVQKPCLSMFTRCLMMCILVFMYFTYMFMLFTCVM
jgi:hypothetical protein